MGALLGRESGDFGDLAMHFDPVITKLLRTEPNGLTQCSLEPRPRNDVIRNLSPDCAIQLPTEP